MAVEDALRLVKMMNANAAKAATGAAGDTAAGQMSPEEMRALAQSAAQRSATASAVAEAALGVQRSKPRENILLDVQDLKMHFPVTSGVIIQRKVADVKAVDGISFNIKEGETLGLVGESGCGKSTTGRAILQLHRPTAGHVYMYDTQAAIASDAPVVKAQAVEGEQGVGIDLTTLKGKSLRRYRRRMQMIFQDPYASLNPRMSVGSIVGEPMAIHGLHKGGKARKERVRDLLNVVGLNPYFASRYPHEFSGGQRQRIGIARALAVEPSFIVADEPVSALDVSIQAQIINLMEDLQKDFGLTYLFIAHDLSVVRHISHRIAVMYLGKIVELTDSDRLYENPLHPYTQALLSAVPIPDPKVERERERIILTGDVPSPLRPPPGCNFHTRCPIAIDVCREEDPEWREIEPEHFAKCHRI
jgi:oligopeptide transport system ATP-binding protein